MGSTSAALRHNKGPQLKGSKAPANPRALWPVEVCWTCHASIFHLILSPPACSLEKHGHGGDEADEAFCPFSAPHMSFLVLPAPRVRLSNSFDLCQVKVDPELRSSFRR